MTVRFYPADAQQKTALRYVEPSDPWFKEDCSDKTISAELTELLENEAVGMGADGMGADGMGADGMGAALIVLFILLPICCLMLGILVTCYCFVKAAKSAVKN